ncbi:Galactose mutarotase [Spirosomataceae bacterium TFI 002]|nr:Galactose mutarotase [Spirosomataceae bacterium TFI 002]
MFCLENESLKIWIKPKGAELKSITKKNTSQEYVWNADPLFWGKSSPILFPIVGALKNNEYHYNGKTYELGRHGFARDRQFVLESKAENKLCFLLKSDEESLKVYPFDFELRIIYTIEERNELVVSYEVKNVGSKQMYFSIGAHPAFQVPLDEELSYSDYNLVFSEVENAERWHLNAAGLLTGQTELMDATLKTLPLHKDLFEKDALVFKGLKSETIELNSKNSRRGLKFKFKDFPYFGIWSVPKANFVCLEPWCGIADSADHNQNLTEKEGIISLAAGKVFTRGWSVQVF